MSRTRGAVAAAFACAVTTLALVAPASRSNVSLAAPLPGILDGYVFPGNDPSRVVIAFDVSPRLARGTATATFFDPNVLYAIDVDNVGDGNEHLTLEFQARGMGPMQRVVAFGPGVPDSPGTGSVRYPELGATTYNRTSTIDKGISLFAGPRRDPLFFDRVQLSRIVARIATCFREPSRAENAYRDENALAIVAEIPKTLLAPRKLGRIGVWWTASLANPGGDAFHEVSRVGRPGVRELASLPSGASRSTELAARIARFFSVDELQADVEAPGQAGYLTIETATPTPVPLATMKRAPPAYRPFGGRAPANPAMAGTLGALYGDMLPRASLAPEDGRETPCLTTDNTTPPPNPAASSFPYLDDPI